MTRRMIGLAAAACMAFVALPAASQADEVDTGCKNGSDPVHYQLTDASPLVKLELRLLCVRD